MTLYSADVLDMAKPVPKKGKVKKSDVEVVDPEPTIEATSVKEKKAPTEKQLAALAKAQESRKRKREEIEIAKVAAAEQEKLLIAAAEEKQKLAQAKKDAAKEKRLAKKQQQQQQEQQLPSPAESLDEEIDRAVEEIVPPAPVHKKSKNDEGAPAWFKQYVAGVKKEEAVISSDKKPKKQIQREAEDHAQKNWSDSFTRDRVRNEVDGHMSRMYQMMFTGRKMK
jgi:hypothetical protein